MTCRFDWDELEREHNSSVLYDDEDVWLTEEQVRLRIEQNFRSRLGLPVADSRLVADIDLDCKLPADVLGLDECEELDDYCYVLLFPPAYRSTMSRIGKDAEKRRLEPAILYLGVSPDAVLHRYGSSYHVPAPGEEPRYGGEVVKLSQVPSEARIGKRPERQVARLGTTYHNSEAELTMQCSSSSCGVRGPCVREHVRDQFLNGCLVHGIPSAKREDGSWRSRDVRAVENAAASLATLEEIPPWASHRGVPWEDYVLCFRQCVTPVLWALQRGRGSLEDWSCREEPEEVEGFEAMAWAAHIHSPPWPEDDRPKFDGTWQEYVVSFPTSGTIERLTDEDFDFLRKPSDDKAEPMRSLGKRVLAQHVGCDATVDGLVMVNLAEAFGVTEVVHRQSFVYRKMLAKGEAGNSSRDVRAAFFVFVGLLCKSGGHVAVHDWLKFSSFRTVFDLWVDSGYDPPPTGEGAEREIKEALVNCGAVEVADWRDLGKPFPSAVVCDRKEDKPAIRRMLGEPVAILAAEELGYRKFHSLWYVHFPGEVRRDMLSGRYGAWLLSDAAKEFSYVNPTKEPTVLARYLRELREQWTARGRRMQLGISDADTDLSGYGH